MDRWNRGGVIKQRSDYQDDSDGEYHEPQEPVLHYPKQNQSPSEYSDRRPWTPGKESKNIADILPPRLPKRPPGCAPPIVNRDLKPGRQPKNIPEPWAQNKGSYERKTTTPPRPARNQPQDCLDHGSVSAQPKFNSRPHTSSYGASSTEEESVSNNRLIIGSKGGSINRHSLDLESYDMERRLSLEENAVRDTYKLRHHEWPQDKGDAENNNYTGHDKPVEASADQNWYVGAFSRVEAEHALHLVNQEGAFLVRDCSRNTTQEPFVLAIFYNNRVFNIQIRFCMETCKYMLGTKVKTDDRFDSVAEIIKFHTIFPILLIDGRNPSAASNSKRQCLLMYPVTKQDMDLLLNKTSLQSSAEQMQ